MNQGRAALKKSSGREGPFSLIWAGTEEKAPRVQAQAAGTPGKKIMVSSFIHSGCHSHLCIKKLSLTLFCPGIGAIETMLLSSIY